MKKFLLTLFSLIISLILIFTYFNIVKEHNLKKLEETSIPTNKVDPQTILVKNYLQKLINSNYDFLINIANKEFVLTYTGTFFDDITKGKRYTTPPVEGLNSVSYQIEDQKCYNSETKEEIFNAYYEADYEYIFLYNILTKLNNASCDTNENILTCQETNAKYTFIINDDNITDIEIELIDNPYYYKYTHKYSNINNTITLNKINNSKYFDITSNLNNPNTANLNSNYIEYGISNINITLNQEKYTYSNINDLIKHAKYSKVYNNNITKYILDDDYVIFIKNNYTSQKIIFSLNKYTNAILKLLNK